MNTPDMRGRASRHNRMLSVALVSAGLAISGCGGSSKPHRKHKPVAKAPTEQVRTSSTVSNQEVSATADRYARFIEHLRQTKPLTNDLTYEGCKSIGLPEEGYKSGSIVERTILEAHNGKGGYAFYVTEKTDKDGKGLPSEAEDVEMVEYKLSGCKDHEIQGTTKDVEIGLDSISGLALTPADKGWAMSDSHGTLGGPVPVASYTTYQSRNIKLRVPALTPDVYLVYNQDAEVLLTNAAHQSSVTNTMVPNIG